ncbi:MAG: hypothetical protein DME97_16645 [Verrucomicrobia bacterium]|nr:MAG: hypothetical protein DME97_16645 [Verrucomicrobiota bacterium]
MRTEMERSVYEISVADLQRVATEVLGRNLSDREIAVVGKSVGDYIDWFEAIETTINNHLSLQSPTPP